MTELPPIPKHIMGILGPISIVRAEFLTDDEGKPASGLWESHARRISIEESESMPAIRAFWVLWHEVTHSILDDLSVELPPEKEERVCDAVATAMTLHYSGHRVSLPL